MCSLIPRSYKEDRNVVTIELHGAPDERGRHHFTMYWFCESFERWRAQCFHANHANPAEHREYWRKRGRKVVTVRED